MSEHLRIPKQVFQHWLWESKKQYDQFDALLDLQQMASEKKIVLPVRNKTIPLSRGELVASQRFLEERWKWSREKVRNYMRLLIKEGVIKARIEQGETIVTMLRYWGEAKPKPEPKKKAAKKKFIVPSFEEFQAYLLEKLPRINPEWTEERVKRAAETQYEIFENTNTNGLGWKDGYDNPVKCWKNKTTNILRNHKPWSYGSEKQQEKQTVKYSI